MTGRLARPAIFALLGAAALALAGFYVLAVFEFVSQTPRTGSKRLTSTAQLGAFVMHEAPRPLAEIVFVDGDGQSLMLADFRAKTVLLNIWATWCVPCRKEMPTLDALQGQLGGAEFQVVALSIDRAGAEVVRKFYAEIGIGNLALFIDTSMRAALALGTVGLPTTLLIDAEGRERGRLVGPAEWNSPEMIAFLKAHVASN